MNGEPIRVAATVAGPEAAAKRAAMVEKRRAANQRAMARNVKTLKAIIRARVAAKSG